MPAFDRYSRLAAEVHLALSALHGIPSGLKSIQNGVERQWHFETLALTSPMRLRELGKKFWDGHLVVIERDLVERLVRAGRYCKGELVDNPDSVAWKFIHEALATAEVAGFGGKRFPCGKKGCKGGSPCEECEV